MQGRGNLFAVDHVALRKFLTKAQMGTLTVNIPGPNKHLSPFSSLGRRCAKLEVIRASFTAFRGRKTNFGQQLVAPPDS